MGENKRGSAPAVGGSSLLVSCCAMPDGVRPAGPVHRTGGPAPGRRRGPGRGGYYQADAQAQEILSRLRAGERPQGVEEENGVFSYQCPISDTQTLQVEVKLEGETYTVLRWQADYTGTWQADEDLSVWTGES